MADMNSSMSCKTKSQIAAALAGLLMLVLLRAWRHYPMVGAIIGAAVIAYIVYYVLQTYYCPADPAEAATAPRASAAPAPNPAPTPAPKPAPAAAAAAAAPAAPAAAPAAAAPKPAPAAPAAAAPKPAPAPKPAAPAAAKPAAPKPAAPKAEAPKAEAPRAAGKKPEPMAAARGGAADDLKQIKGVGPKLEQLLHSLGVFHFDQIADWKGAEIRWMDDNLEGFKGRVSRDEWVKQARILVRDARKAAGN